MAVLEVIGHQPVEVLLEALGLGTRAEHLERRAARDNLQLGMQLPNLVQIDVLGSVELAGVDPLDEYLSADCLRHGQKI